MTTDTYVYDIPFLQKAAVIPFLSAKANPDHGARSFLYSLDHNSDA